jgi:hypothetical protein
MPTASNQTKHPARLACAARDDSFFGWRELWVKLKRDRLSALLWDYCRRFAMRKLESAEAAGG